MGPRRPLNAGPYDVRIGGTGADGIVVHIVKGWRTILCADGTEMKRIPAALVSAAAPLAALRAKAAKWRAPKPTPRSKPPPRSARRARRVPILARAARARARARCTPPRTQQRPKGAPGGRRLRPRGQVAGRMAVAVFELIASGPCGASGGLVFASWTTTS